MSLVLNILKEVYEAEFNYKGVRVNGFGIPTAFLASGKSERDTLYRLSREGYIKKDEGGWRITNQGKSKLKKADYLKSFHSPFSSQSKRNLLLTFDIPESQKVKREWLRMHLKEFNYKMVQRSVWVGPSPLPKEFLDYLKEIKIEKYIKTIKLSKNQK
jgi:CRISPR-associated endonuclease Cas2